MKSITYSLFIIIALFCGCNVKKDTYKIVSLNIRFENNRDGENNWFNRKSLVTLFLNEEKPDIICLQEVLKPQLVYLQGMLSSYKSVSVGYMDGKSKGVHTPLFYDTTKIQLLEKGCFWLSETPGKNGSIGWDAARSRIVTWAKIKFIKQGSTIYIMNTHLDHKGEVARIESAKLIMNWIKIHTSTYPVILCGDFNTAQDSDVYHVITDNNKLIDSYKNASKITGVNYSFHSYGKRAMQKRTKIDYVFVSKEIKVVSIDIPEEARDNRFMLSDHNPIIVELQIPNR